MRIKKTKGNPYVNDILNPQYVKSMGAASSGTKKIASVGARTV
jgi:hypothetical protein